jgi:hypothetical protein
MISHTWYALPPILAISLVYAATRHERLLPIFLQAFKVSLWIIGLMLVAFGLLQLVSMQVS